MSVTESPALDWRDKQEKAAKLLEDIKTAAATGVKDAEHSQELEAKMADVRELGREIKAYKDAEQAMRDARAIVEEAKAAGASSAYLDTVESKAYETSTSNEPAEFTGKQRIAYGENIKQSPVFTKALSGAAAGTGGALVPPAYMQELFAETRRQGNALRRYNVLNEHPVEGTNQIILPRGAGAASVGWVAENATKPSADQSYTQLTVNIFTLAGISKVSLQMVQDANPTVADFVSRELGSLLGNAEEAAIINGSGTGQPKGIIQVGASLALNRTTSAVTNGQGVVTDIFDAASAVAQNYYLPPNAIIMHPKRLNYLMKTLDSQNNFLFNPPGNFRGPGGLGGLGALTALDMSEVATIAGIPVIVTTNMPTNVTGTSDAVIVGNFTEAHWFQRMELTLDASTEAGTAFEQNQVWYRLEERVGFTAERYPLAFALTTGNVAAYNT